MEATIEKIAGGVPQMGATTSAVTHRLKFLTAAFQKRRLKLSPFSFFF